MSAFSLSEDGGIMTITLNDPAELNDFRSSVFRDSLYEMVLRHETPHVILDLSASDYLSSSGVATLVGLKRRVETKNGTLVLARVQPPVFSLLKIMKLVQYFTFKDGA